MAHRPPRSRMLGILVPTDDWRQTQEMRYEMRYEMRHEMRVGANRCHRGASAHGAGA